MGVKGLRQQGQGTLEISLMLLDNRKVIERIDLCGPSFKYLNILGCGGLDLAPAVGVNRFGDQLTRALPL